MLEQIHHPSEALAPSSAQGKERIAQEPLHVGDLNNYPNAQSAFYSYLKPHEQDEVIQLAEEIGRHTNSASHLVLDVLEKVFEIIMQHNTLQTERGIETRDAMHGDIDEQMKWTGRKSKAQFTGAFLPLLTMGLARVLNFNHEQVANISGMLTSGMSTFFDAKNIRPSADFRMRETDQSSDKQTKGMSLQTLQEMERAMGRLGELEVEVVRRATQG